MYLCWKTEMCKLSKNPKSILENLQKFSILGWTNDKPNSSTTALAVFWLLYALLCNCLLFPENCCTFESIIYTIDNKTNFWLIMSLFSAEKIFSLYSSKQIYSKTQFISSLVDSTKQGCKQDFRHSCLKSHKKQQQQHFSFHYWLNWPN